MTAFFDRRKPDRRLSVAPMMDRTDRHCRYFLRLISRRVLLYTEMVTTAAILHGDREKLLDFDEMEHPVALQIGGSAPDELRECARIAEAMGFDEVNLNLGCPSDRVQSGRFGACLMAEPELVARGVAAMVTATRLRITVKTRIGIDDRDSYPELLEFIRRLADAGCRSFAIHARKAWLRGLSPKQNREIPPLRYELVHRLKADNPDLEIVLNGGILSLDQAEAQLRAVDGVMIGRAAYHNPYMLAEADRRFFGDPDPMPSRGDIIESLVAYAERELAAGARLTSLTRHILGLFQGLPGARAWRRILSSEGIRPDAGPEIIRSAAREVPLAALQARPLATFSDAASGVPNPAPA